MARHGLLLGALVFVFTAGCRGATNKTKVNQMNMQSYETAIAEWPPELITSMNGNLVEIFVRNNAGQTNSCMGIIAGGRSVIVAGHCFAGIQNGSTACKNGQVVLKQLHVSQTAPYELQADPINCSQLLVSDTRDVARIDLLPGPVFGNLPRSAFDPFAQINRNWNGVVVEGNTRSHPDATVIFRDADGELVASNSRGGGHLLLADPNLKDILVHTSSTLPGTSGSPMFTPNGSRLYEIYGIHLGGFHPKMVATSSPLLHPTLMEYAQQWDALNYFQYMTPEVMNFALAQTDRVELPGRMPNLEQLLGEAVVEKDERALGICGLSNVGAGQGELPIGRFQVGTLKCVATALGDGTVVTVDHCVPQGSTPIQWENGAQGTLQGGSPRPGSPGLSNLTTTGRPQSNIRLNGSAGSGGQQEICLLLFNGVGVSQVATQQRDRCSLSNGRVTCDGLAERALFTSGAPIFIKGNQAAIGLYDQNSGTVVLGY